MITNLFFYQLAINQFTDTIFVKKLKYHAKFDVIYIMPRVNVIVMSQLDVNMRGRTLVRHVVRDTLVSDTMLQTRLNTVPVSRNSSGIIDNMCSHMRPRTCNH